MITEFKAQIILPSLLYTSFVPHQVDVSTSTQVVGKSNEILKNTSGHEAHWSTYISMYKSQQVTDPLTVTSEMCFSHLPKQTRLARVK
jgi:hypothetical protein